MDISRQFGIGTLSKQTNVKVETIRYYEREGLLPKPPRTTGGHRSYSGDDLKRLTFIRRARELGFSMGDIRDLLALVDGGAYTCSEVRSVTLEHAERVRRKISDLRRMEGTLLSVSAQCEGGAVPDCPIIDALFELEKGSNIEALNIVHQGPVWVDSGLLVFSYLAISPARQMPIKHTNQPPSDPLEPFRLVGINLKPGPLHFGNRFAKHL